MFRRDGSNFVDINILWIPIFVAEFIDLFWDSILKLKQVTPDSKNNG